MNTHIIPKRTYFVVFTALLTLLLVTVAAAFVHLGPFNLVLAITIAVSKALLIVLYFMHVRGAARLLWVFVGAGFVWLTILISLVMADYLTRGWQM